MPLAAAPNARWSLDFAADVLADGRRFRILCVVDDCTRECLALIADTSLSGVRVARELGAIAAVRGTPGAIVSDNGTELTKAWRCCAGRRSAALPALHCAGQAAAERLCRELHRASARRVPERDGIHLSAPCMCGAGGMATRLQRGAPALGAARPDAGLDQGATVLACVNAASRRLRRWPAASIDADCARRWGGRRPGQGNGARPNRETPSRWA